MKKRVKYLHRIAFLSSTRKKSMSDSWQSYHKQQEKVRSLKRKELKAFFFMASTNTKNPGEFWKR